MWINRASTVEFRMPEVVSFDDNEVVDHVSTHYFVRAVSEDAMGHTGALRLPVLCARGN